MALSSIFNVSEFLFFEIDKIKSSSCTYYFLHYKRGTSPQTLLNFQITSNFAKLSNYTIVVCLKQFLLFLVQYMDFGGTDIWVSFSEWVVLKVIFWYQELSQIQPLTSQYELMNQPFIPFKITSYT